MMNKKVEELRKMAEGKEKIHERMTKWRTDQICFPRDLNIHDPDNKYRWADEPTPEQVRLVRILRVLGVISAVILLGVML
jgi:hypothetical protein